MAAQIHLIGFIAAVVGLLILLSLSFQKPESSHFYACLVFGITSALVFGVSTTYHFMSDGFQISAELEQFMENLDHIAIFLFIAGTYTPLTINAIAAPWDRILLWLVWSVCLGGIAYTVFRSRLPSWARHRYANTSIFVLMGWLILVRIGELVSHLSARENLLLMVGCAVYTAGAIVYALRKPNLFHGIFGYHELWHLMVLLGFISHYLLILEFYA